jgi:hypothetical protein
MSGLVVRPVETARDLTRFIDFAYDIYRDDPNAAPMLRRDAHELLNPKKNPWFEHARARFFLAERDGKVVGRISAQIDNLVLQYMGAGTGQWGSFELIDDPAVASALFDAAEGWLRAQGMTRAMGPFTLSIWDEPGLLIEGFDHPPTVMMGHHRDYYAKHVEARGYVKAKDLFTYDLPVDVPFPKVIQRVIKTGLDNKRIVVRDTNMKQYAKESKFILEILNDAWADNWGFTPLTPAESVYAGKKMRPVVYKDLVRVAELDGEPIAFMFTLPNLNEVTASFNGRLFPFNFIALLRAIRNPRPRSVRVPLMGVLKKYQGTRTASLAAFMMIENIRNTASTKYGAKRAEIGWILEDNAPMRGIAEAIASRINKVYRIYERAL